MHRPKLVVMHPEQSDRSRSSMEDKKYRFELSRKKLTLCIGGFALALCWMFIFGILVGRGISLVNSEDISVRADVMRFMGLANKPAEPAPKAAETWQDPKKMMESLNYYEDLTGQGNSPMAEPPGTEPREAPPAAAPAPPVETPPKRASAPRPTPEKAAPPEQEQTAKPAPAPTPTPAPAATAAPAPNTVDTGGHFTLLVGSLKDPENAQRLIEQLTRKGYSPRLEALDLNGGGRWNRVLVGSFQSRDAALKFAADFNKKENMEGLVIRESN